MRKLLPVLLALLVSGCVSEYEFACKLVRERDVGERVGIIANADIAWKDSTRPLVRALAYFKAQGADRVIVLGDPTKDGYPNQREVFDDACRRALGGAEKPKVVVAGDPFVLGGISFTGRGRLPLTDLLCAYPPDGKLVNAGSLHGIKVSGVFDRHAGKAGEKFVSSAQGLFVLVRPQSLEIHRVDFSDRFAEEVGPAWLVDGAGKVHCEEGTPQFWPDTSVNVTRGYDEKGQVVYTVRWPPVLACFTGVRAFSYDVTVGDEVVRRVQSKGFHRSEAHDREAITCQISARQLGKRPPRFGITPISSLGKRGTTVWSE